MLFTLLIHYLEPCITDTSVKYQDLCTVSLLLYLMALKIIPPGCGIRASVMLFLIVYTTGHWNVTEKLGLIYLTLLSLSTHRVMIYASDTVNTIYDDATCTSGECYSLCGEIHTPPGFDKYSADVVIRRFHVKLTEIESLVGESICRQCFANYYLYN